VGLTIAIAGGGVGGLTAAIALDRRGHDVRLFEKAASFTDVGAGLSLWPNALAALGRLDLERQVMDCGYWEDDGAIRSPDGAVLRELENTNLMILRSELQRVLVAALGDIPVALGARCTGVSANGRAPVLRLADGTSVEADLVIGADGIRSAVRQSIAPDDDPPRYSGLCAWRGVVRAPDMVDSAWLSVGNGLQFLAAPLVDDHVYWSPLVRLDEGRWDGISDHRGFLLDRFRAWHEPIPTLVDRTPNDVLLPTPVYFRPPPTWVTRGRVALIGDAAHPMTPDLGQGGCQAIEDAVVLADCVSSGSDDIELALRQFAERRLGRIRRVVREARQLGVVMAEDHRPAMRLRTTALRLVPARLTDRRLSAITGREAFEAQLAPT
jgi:2-polyprenyl-6-methoxyphenol hydroxylase-like FAD-dependent oxidoreductase